jgi:predicted dehydrogenase
MSLQTTVAGCGAVAQRLYRKPLQQLERRGILRVAALVDPVTDHAETFGAFFPKATKYRQLDEALSAMPPELTLVLSPAHLHADQAVAAMKHRSHVLCEKPMANNTADCARMNDVAHETGRVLAVGMIRRFFPAFAQLQHIVAGGGLGALQSFEYREGHKFEWEVTTPAAFRPRHEGGTGVLFDIGPHVVDHLAWTFGELRVHAYADDALAGIESNMSMEVESAACPGSIHLSWDSPQSNELRVLGSTGEAVLRIDQFDQLAIRRGGAFEPQPITVAFPADTAAAPREVLSPRSYPQAVYCQLVQTARAITHGEAPAVDGPGGVRIVALLESALRMAQPLEMPWLDASEREAYAQLHWTRR